MPDRSWSNVLLPHPLGPTTAMLPLRGILKSSPESAVTPPGYANETSSTEIPPLAPFDWAALRL
jgi:hypothetical protein